MSNNVVPLFKEYAAVRFTAKTAYGDFVTSGTLCGSIDFVDPSGSVHVLTPDEAQSVIAALSNARKDVLENSNPFGDGRVYD